MNECILVQYDTFPFETNKKAFELRIQKLSKGDDPYPGMRRDFLLSPLVPAALVQHQVYYSNLPKAQRPNIEMVQYMKAQVAQEHAISFLQSNANPTVEALYNHLEAVFALFPIVMEQKRELFVSKASTMQALIDRKNASPETSDFPEPSFEFLNQVRLESRFDGFITEFEPMYVMFERTFRSKTQPTWGSGRRPAMLDHNDFQRVMDKKAVSKEDLTRAFQFEAWFFSHFVWVNGEEQVPDSNWKSTVMHLLSAPDMPLLQRLNPDSLLGVWCLCGRISDETNVNHIPAQKNFTWENCAALAAASTNPSAQTKGEAVVRVMNEESSKIGMSQRYLVTQAGLVMQVMNWLTEAANPDTQTPFGYALQHYRTVAEHFVTLEREQEEAALRAQRLERAKAQQAQWKAAEAERQSLAQDKRQCPNPGCDTVFTFYYPKGLTAETYQSDTKEGELNMDLYCKPCSELLCYHCKAAFCLYPDETAMHLCGTCKEIPCQYCPAKVHNYRLLDKKVCNLCYEKRGCQKCGGLIPNHNRQILLCFDCNTCKGQCNGGPLLTISEQVLVMCNVCLQNFHDNDD